MHRHRLERRYDSHQTGDTAAGPNWNQAITDTCRVDHANVLKVLCE